MNANYNINKLTWMGGIDKIIFILSILDLSGNNHHNLLDFFYPGLTFNGFLIVSYSNNNVAVSLGYEIAIIRNLK